MTTRPPRLQTVRLQNFKAVRDSQTIHLSPLTVFIGNNGSGKSSIIEGLETLQTIITQGLDEAMDRWLGFEQIYHGGLTSTAKPKKPKTPLQRPYIANPMQFDLRGDTGQRSFKAHMSIALGESGNDLFIQSEKATIRDRVDKWQAELSRDDRGNGRSSLDTQIVVDAPFKRGAQEHDLQRHINQERVFEGVVVGLAAGMERLFNRIRGARDGAFGGVMAKRGAVASSSGGPSSAP